VTGDPLSVAKDARRNLTLTHAESSTTIFRHSLDSQLAIAIHIQFLIQLQTTDFAINHVQHILFPNT